MAITPRTPRLTSSQNEIKARATARMLTRAYRRQRKLSEWIREHGGHCAGGERSAGFVGLANQSQA